MPAVALALLITVGQAVAQEDAPAVASEAAAESGGPAMGVNLRYRYMFAPKFIVDSFYFDNDDPGALDYERPKVSAHVMGLEFAVEPAPASILMYTEYWKINMDQGYWDDKEDPPEHTDGDWLEADGIGVVALGADFGHEVEVSSSDKDVWVGFRMGGGLGLGIPVGNIKQWHAGREISTDPTNNCLPTSFSFDRYENCAPDEDLQIWPVLPILDLDLGWRFHFGEAGLLRLDAGIHDMFYGGAALGVVF